MFLLDSNQPVASFSCAFFFSFFSVGFCEREQVTTTQFWRLSANSHYMVDLCELKSSLQMLSWWSFTCTLATFYCGPCCPFVQVWTIFQGSESKVLDYPLLYQPPFSTEIFSGLWAHLVEAFIAIQNQASKAN